jgi:Fe-S oxidoreductase
MAALEVLETAGISVSVAPTVCCGRPLISQGLLDEARALAVNSVVALHDVVARGDTLVLLEPSCLSAIKEDVPALLRGNLQRRAREIASIAMLFEEYLERECQHGRAALPLAEGPAQVLLHPHCHQRAMGLAPAARALLSRIPRTIVTDLDAGCCGMAGSFGYSRDHYDVSRAIGELKLLPAARAMATSQRAEPRAPSVLVAAGTSCRHQVAHFAGVTALHPAVLLQRTLNPDRRGH